MATIEVKSILDKAAIAQSMSAAITAKALQRHLVTSFSAGYQPPAILNYVIAYDGPATMATVGEWVRAVDQENSVVYPALLPTIEARTSVASPSVDGIFVLGKGFWYFDNAPMGLIPDSLRAQHPRLKWVFLDTPENNLLLLFLFLTFAVSGVSGSWLNPVPYLSGLPFNGISLAG